MESQFIQLLKDISIPAVFALFILFILKPLLPLFMDWFRTKINGNDNPTIRESVDIITNNHLVEINRRLDKLEQSDIRIYDKLDKLSQEVAYLKAKIK